MKRNLAHIQGCLIGGAIGDALGAPVQFMNYKTIIKTYGEQGLTRLVYPMIGQKAHITDDTQLTLFTAEGLLRSIVREKKKNLEHNNKEVGIVVFRAYLRWLYTQGLKTPHWDSKSYDGWLIKTSELHAYREPGVTSITSLGKGIMGTFARPINNSKKCGGVGRVAPVGLVEEDQVFDIGCRVGAITHGHPTAYLSSGAFATIIYYIIEGLEIEDAVQKAIDHLKQQPDSQECISKLEQALTLAKDGEASSEQLMSLGQGILAEEALAMGIYCALSAKGNFKKGIILAINHDGDSDSIGAITGNILGAYLGVDQIDEELVKGIELLPELKKIAEDLYIKYEDNDAWEKKYPGW